jgi:glycerophosphoryl diester phosphodiesterase
MEVRENSLSGLRATLASGTADVLDLDTQELGDGTIVLLHDGTVDRVTDRTGPARTYDAASWRTVSLDLGSWLTPPPPREPAPTLADALDTFGGRVVMTVEAKSAGSVPRIGRMLRERGLTGSVYINTNDPATARRIHDLGIRSHLWRNATQLATDDPTTFASYVDLLDVDQKASDADLARAVRSGVPRVWVHTVTTRAERDRALRLGAGGIVTDDPRYVSGRTSRFPRTPVVVNVHAAPATVQVSDDSSTLLLPWQQSGPVVPTSPVVSGGGVTSTAAPADLFGRHRITLLTGGARAGRIPLTITVPTGARGEQSWTAGSAATSISLVGEDLQVAPTAKVARRAVDLRVRLLDSAATGYRGPRAERGAARTVAGLDRASLTVSITRAGARTVLRTIRLAGRDTGDPTNGNGVVRFRWTAPAPGSYTALVRQAGTTYATVGARVAFRVR